MRKPMTAFTVLLALGLPALGLGACESMTRGEKGAVTGAAVGSGVGMIAGGSFGQVVGAGLVGGALGYIVGETTK